MRLLLDTNILILLILREQSRLPDEIRRGLSADGIVAHASAASLWEIAIKVRSGKLALSVELDRIPAQLDQLEIDPLPITFSHVLAELAPVPPTKDPFDRLLLAQCQVEGLRLVTLDRVLAAHPLAWRET